MKRRKKDKRQEPAGPAKDKEYKYEYAHFDLGYGMHYGMHSIFGEHLALGSGSNMVHIYPYKIYIGADPTKAVDLDAEQQRVIKNIMKVIKRRIQASELDAELETGIIKEEESNANT